MGLRRMWSLGLCLTLAAGCRGGVDLDTRTFPLRHLPPGEAEALVAPYVYGDRPEAPGRLSVTQGAISVRETPDNLEKIARVLEAYDRAEPGVRLRFQLIQANGAAGSDPRIADVEEALREFFRFEGYRLEAEAQFAVITGSRSVQAIAGDSARYALEAEVRDVRTDSAGGVVRLEVLLRMEGGFAGLSSTVSVPIGETMILGGSTPVPGRGPVILTVRPELIEG